MSVLQVVVAVAVLAVYPSLAVNILFNPTDLAPYQDNPLQVRLLDTIRIDCSDIVNTRLYSIDSESIYENCTAISGIAAIGHCLNSPLIININEFSGPLGRSYPPGTTSYVIAYSESGSNTTYCENGYKFKFHVVDPNVIPSSSTMQLPSSSSASSSTVIPTTLQSTADMTSSTSNMDGSHGTTSTTTSTISLTPSLTVTANDQTPRPTIVSQSSSSSTEVKPTVGPVDVLAVEVIGGSVAGTIAFIVLITVVLVLSILLIVLICKQRRGSVVIAHSTTFNSEKPFLSSPTSSVVSTMTREGTLAGKEGDYEEVDHVVALPILSPPDYMQTMSRYPVVYKVSLQPPAVPPEDSLPRLMTL
jgi:hypothetical protein